MKKILLFSALACAALGAYAEDFGSYFRIELNGKELSNGEKIVSTDLEPLDPEFPEWGAEYKNLDIDVISLKETAVPIYVRVTVDKTTAGGTYMNCLNNYYDEKNGSLASNCIGNPFNQFFMVPSASILAANGNATPMQLQLEAMCNDGNPFVIEGNLYLSACSGESLDEAEQLDDANMTINFAFDKDSSVAEIKASGDKADYYTIQGVKVAQPEESGLYIRVQDGKARKVLVK